MNEDARKEADKVLNRMKQEGKDSMNMDFSMTILILSSVFPGSIRNLHRLI